MIYVNDPAPVSVRRALWGTMSKLVFESKDTNSDSPPLKHGSLFGKLAQDGSEDLSGSSVTCASLVRFCQIDPFVFGRCRIWKEILSGSTNAFLGMV